MPELPEVETVLRGMEGAMRGQVIENVTVNRRDLRVPVPDDFESRAVSGQKLKDFQRRGKYIVIGLSQADVMILHLGMSGRVRIYKETPYEAAKHDHVIFEMCDGAKLAFEDPRRFGFLYLSPADRWQTESPFALMGPEPLSNDFSPASLAERIVKRQSPIKNVLLDQNIVAGLGNIYVCEALYMSGIDPRRKAASLKPKEIELLVPAIREVLTKAIAAGGSTLRDYQHTDGSLGYFQHQFAVYDREGERCPDCKCDIMKTSGVQRIVQSNRSTYYCGQRQK